VPPTGAPGARFWNGEKRRLDGAALNGREKSHKIQLCSRQTPDKNATLHSGGIMQLT
jgi:hypothetical protein